MSLYVEPTLRLTMSYPKGFVPRVPETLEAVLEREHLSTSEDAPTECMHTIFRATRSAGTSGGSTPETILLMDVDRFCLAGRMNGSQGLAMVADTVLRMRGVIPLVATSVRRVKEHQGHPIHAGMSAGMMIADEAVPGSDGAAFGVQMPVYVMAASFEQQQHWLLVLYLSGAYGKQRATIGSMSVSFDGQQQVSLFPFLAGRAVDGE